MKNTLHRNPKTNKTHTKYLDYDEHTHHNSKRIKTHIMQKANNALDKALKRKDWKGVYDTDDYY